jgi:hypothetical protein
MWQALLLHATTFSEDLRVINFSAVVLLQLLGWRFQHVIPVPLIVSFQTTADILVHMQQGTTSMKASFYESESRSLSDNSLNDNYFNIFKKSISGDQIKVDKIFE